MLRAWARSMLLYRILMAAVSGELTPGEDRGLLWDLLRYGGWMNARRGISARSALRRILRPPQSVAGDPAPLRLFQAFPCLSITHQTINRCGLTGGAGGPR